MTDLSVIVLSYNTCELTENCLTSLTTTLDESSLSWEVIVVDNASEDNSVRMLKEFAKKFDKEGSKVHLILNKQNVGFSRGNNQAVAEAHGNYILFLNSDTITEAVNFDELVEYFNKNEKVGALTVRVVLNRAGALDPASHRGFPTVWNSFTYYSGLEKVLGRVPFFAPYVGGYHQTHKNLNTIHEIDALSGAFFMTRKSVLQELGGFDDVNFFMYGEDLDLAYRIKAAGYKIIYYPAYTIIHLKYASGLKRRHRVTQEATKKHFYDAMRAFYKKHYERQNPGVVNAIVHFFISLKERLS